MSMPSLSAIYMKALHDMKTPDAMPAGLGRAVVHSGMHISTPQSDYGLLSPDTCHLITTSLASNGSGGSLPRSVAGAS